MQPEEELNALRNADVVLGYTPMGDEPEFGEFLKGKNINKRGLSVIADPAIPPFVFAHSLVEQFKTKKVCIFVPGMAFDHRGTRHGRGGGWYDRFLSAVPRGWKRIGVLHREQLSDQSLDRQTWDQPMDLLLLRNNAGWELVGVESI